MFHIRTITMHTEIFPLHPQIHTMADERSPTTHSYFATEDARNIIVLPSQATTHERGGLHQLVCLPLPRQEVAKMEPCHAQLVPQSEITTVNMVKIFTSIITYECSIEDNENMPNSWLPIAATENPQPTQEFVSGRIT